MFIFTSNMLLKEIMLVKRITAVLCFFLFPTLCNASLSEGPERDSCIECVAAAFNRAGYIARR